MAWGNVMRGRVRREHLYHVELYVSTRGSTQVWSPPCCLAISGEGRSCSCGSWLQNICSGPGTTTEPSTRIAANAIKLAATSWKLLLDPERNIRTISVRPISNKYRNACDWKIGREAITPRHPLAWTSLSSASTYVQNAENNKKDVTALRFANRHGCS